MSGFEKKISFIFGQEGSIIRKVGALILSSCAVLFALGWYLSSLLMYMKKKDEKFIYNRELTAGRLCPDEFAALPKQETAVLSPFGYELKVLLVEPYQTNRYILIAHGVTENKVNSIKYLNLFLKRGFNAIIYDHRRHGESGGKTTSYGHYEKFDLKAVIDWLKKEKGPDLLLGIHGESMGAATMLLYAGMLEDDADFYIADCPFSDFKELLYYRLKKEIKILPWFFLHLTGLFVRLRDHYSLKKVSPISFVDQIKHPILFIHSKKDDYILASMTEALFARKQGPKMLYLAENGLHAQSFNENSAEYEKAIERFLQTYVCGSAGADHI